MPHILMRFFTVPTAKDARVSVIWAMAIIGGFYVLTLFLGNGAAINVGAAEITRIDKGGNMAAPLLAQFVGGGADSFMGNFLLAFVAAVAFATIVAVVAGLVLASASAMSHDIWVGVVKGEHATPEEEVRAARISSILVGIVAIIIGIAAKGQNVAHLVAMAFAVAASGNLPAVLLTLYWKKCNTGGIIAGMLLGSFSAIALVMISPNMTYPAAIKAAATKVIEGTPAQAEKAADPGNWGFMCDIFALSSCKKATAAQPAKPAVAGTKQKIADLEAALVAEQDAAAKAKLEGDLKKVKEAQAKAEADLKKFANDNTSMVGLEKPFFLLKNPGLISIPLGFLAVFLGSLLYRDKRAEDMWEELYVRQNTGIAAEGAVAH
jgi:cation/acetate symporter